VTNIDLLKCERVGSRELQADTKRILNKTTPTVITLFGKPKAVLVPYETMVDLLEIVWRYEDLSK
jgi:prevent-host-death family protein